jgi:hypothetical protein
MCFVSPPVLFEKLGLNHCMKMIESLSLPVLRWPLRLRNAAAPVAKIQAMLAKPSVLCGRFDQTKQLAGMKKPLASERPLLRRRRQGRVVAHAASRSRTRCA